MAGKGRGRKKEGGGREEGGDEGRRGQERGGRRDNNQLVSAEKLTTVSCTNFHKPENNPHSSSIVQNNSIISNTFTG